MELKHDKMDAVRKHVARNNDSALKRFARCAIVGGALMLGCNPAAKSGEQPKPAPQTMSQSVPAMKPASAPSARDVVDKWAKECNGDMSCIQQKAMAANAQNDQYKVSGPMDSDPTRAEERKSTLHTGQEFCFGVTWRSMYGVKIVSTDEAMVKADITIPVGLTGPSVNIVSLEYKFNNMWLLPSTVRDLETIAPNTEVPVAKPGGPSKDLPKCVLPKDAEETRKSVSGEAFLEGLAQALTSFSRLYGEVPEGKTVGFTVVGSNEKELILSVNGPLGGKYVKLDREVKMNIEFIGETAGFFTFSPFKLQTVQMDAKGKVTGTVKMNENSCNSYYMEIFMSEHAGSKPGSSPCTMAAFQRMDRHVELRVGDNIFPGIPSSQKVKSIDAKGVQLDDGSRWDYGQKRTIGEFILTQTFELKKGPKGAPIMDVTFTPDTDSKTRADEVQKEFQKK